jgi:membrane protease YdiL (CAAX protease family)
MMEASPEEMAIEAKQDERSESATASESTTAFWEIVSVTSSFLIAEWLILPFAANNKLVAAVPIGLAFALMLFSHRAHNETAREIGWRLDNFWQAARVLLLPVLAAGLIIVGIGWLSKSLRYDGAQMLEYAVWLPLWGLLQQYVLQGFVNRRAQMLYGPGWRSVLLVALIFALLHLPNPWLALATFTGGIIWAYVYQRAPNLIALALSHALMSMLLAFSLPASTINSLRVGIKYFG